MTESVELCVVIVVHNASATLRDLVQRVRVASGDANVQIVVVDDGSTDDTPVVAAELAATPGVRQTRVEPRGNALRAARAGLALAVGVVVVVLDAAYDAPELIPDLVSTLRDKQLDATFATLRWRDDPRRARRLLYAIGQGLATRAPVAGASLACALTRELADRAAAARASAGTLPALVAGFGANAGAAPRPKGRAAGRAVTSRRDALGSLLLSGALTQWILLGAVVLYVLAGVGFKLMSRSHAGTADVVLLLLAAIAGVIAAVTHVSARLSVRPRPTA